jgi:hypothetical protein
VSLDEDAVHRLADELVSDERRLSLRQALESLRGNDAGPGASAALGKLLADDGFAWRCFAAGLLAAELA